MTYRFIEAGADWSLVPEHMREGLVRYVEDGAIGPHSFLEAVVQNDLRESFGRADHINRVRLFDLVSFLYNYVAAPAWGSPENVQKWIEQRKKERIDNAGH